MYLTLITILTFRFLAGRGTVILTTEVVRRALSPLLAVLILGTGVVAPALDRGGVHGAALEAEHHPSACVQGHDHTICTQLGASRLAPAGGPESPQRASTLELPLPTLAGLPSTPALLAHRHARAPPAA